MVKRKNDSGDGKRPKRKTFLKKGERYRDKHVIMVKELKARYEKLDVKNIKTFEDIPLSEETQEGLKDLGVKEPTEIQKESIGRIF